MERRKALAVATVGAALFISGTTAFAALSVSGGSEPGPPDSALAAATDAGLLAAAQTPAGTEPIDPQVVTVYEDETYLVASGRAGASEGGGGAGGAAGAAGAGGATPSAQASAGGGGGTATPPGAAPTPTNPPTTQAPTTTTTRPSGVPRDWPADRPIPPKPPGCRDGQLEDNGVWNCQGD